MLSSNAIDLIKDLERTSNDTLPPFKTDTVRLVLNEMRTHFNQNVEMINVSRDQDQMGPAIMFALNIRHRAIRRNKRCLLAYLWNRLERIREMRWQIGRILPPEIKSNLSPSEEEWFTNYCTSLSNYMRSIGPTGGLNLLKDLKPPKSLYLEVRSLVDVGEIELDDGEAIVLKKDVQYKMLRSQCESLIHQGILEHVH